MCQGPQQLLQGARGIDQSRNTLTVEQSLELTLVVLASNGTRPQDCPV